MKKRETVRMVESTKSINGTISLSISMTIRSSTRVLLNKEKIEKALAL